MSGKRKETQGPTNAQRMRDIIVPAIRQVDDRSVARKLEVRRETIRHWITQARKDDGEQGVAGRGTQPAAWRVQRAYEVFVLKEPVNR